MFNLFKKNKAILEKKGYLLVATLDPRSSSTINHVYNRDLNLFQKKKIFAIDTIDSVCYFNDIDEMFEVLNNDKRHKRFLAGSNVAGIYYVETFVEVKDKNHYISKTTTKPLYYVPSKMSLHSANDHT